MKLKNLEIFYSSDFFNLKFKEATKSLNSGVCSTLTAHRSWDQFKGLVATRGPCGYCIEQRSFSEGDSWRPLQSLPLAGCLVEKLLILP